MSKSNNNVQRSCKCALLAVSTVTLTACAWNEPSRVEQDFGKSVRVMIAEQIYAPAVASQPGVVVPELTGTAASSSVTTYGAAAEQARKDRTRQTQSVVPATGVATN